MGAVEAGERGDQRRRGSLQLGAQALVRGAHRVRAPPQVGQSVAAVRRVDEQRRDLVGCADETRLGLELGAIARDPGGDRGGRPEPTLDLRRCLCLAEIRDAPGPIALQRGVGGRGVTTNCRRGKTLRRPSSTTRCQRGCR